jgi:DNA modification methylase
MKIPYIVSQIQQMPIENVIACPTNPRTHTTAQIQLVADSIVEFGFVNPILVGTDGIVIAGHARLAAARQLQLDHVPVIVLAHLSQTQRSALAIADNRLPLDAGWDEEKLRLELALLRDQAFHLELTGFAETELERLLATQGDVRNFLEEDVIPSLAAEPNSLRGDLWLLGPHRLLCGDATVDADVERLMASEMADLVFTDPPYNVDYAGYTEDRLTMQGDRLSAGEFRNLLERSFHHYRALVKPAASLYVCHASSWQREVQAALEEAGIAVRCQIIWAKNTFAWGFGRYKFQHEPIFYCHVGGEKDHWYGDKSQSTLWQENKPPANREHPTAKPVELVVRALINSSQSGEIIADLFGGAGSTLIACEQHGRKARLMEIDPRYVDVTVERWQRYVGQQATLEGDGRTYHEVAQCRYKKAA